MGESTYRSVMLVVSSFSPIETDLRYTFTLAPANREVYLSCPKDPEMKG